MTERTEDGSRQNHGATGTDVLSLRRYLSSISGFKIALPSIDDKKKWIAAGLGYVVFCLVYTFTGAAPFRSAVKLSPSLIDDAVPFLSWTIWIYHAQFFFLFVCVMTLKKDISISRTLYSMATASLISFLIFAIYPTVVPRDHLIEGGLTKAAFDFLHMIDSQANSLPSLHVSLAWLAAFGVVDEYGKRGLIALTCALLITISTMTTKQHYFIDVLAGLVLMRVCRAIGSRIIMKIHAR